MNSEPQIYNQDDHGIPPDAIDIDAAKVVRRLREQGYEAFIVGGAVRDLLLKRKPKDFDIATNATPDELRKVFKNSRIIGRRFQIAHVYFKGRKVIEVSTFRRQPQNDGDDNGDDVQMETENNAWGSAEDDALRRDLTINAFFLDPDEMTILDYVGGMEDLKKSNVRVIGDPEVRFAEDPVRMIRAIRHAARTGFLIDPGTWQAICDLRGLIAECNESRIRQEFIREFQEGAAARSVKMLHKSGLLEYLLPEFNTFLHSFNSNPDRKRHYWKLLRLLDREGVNTDLPATLIFAAALGPAIMPELLGVFTGDEKIEIKALQRKLTPYMIAAGIPKSLSEPLAQSLYAQPKLDKARKKNNLPKRLADKSYFGLAMHLFLLRHRAIGSWIPDGWEDKVPSPELIEDNGKPKQDKKKRSRSRRRRGGRKQDGAPADKQGDKKPDKPAPTS